MDFNNIFGDNEEIRILECLIENKNESLSINEIKEITDIKINIIRKYINFLLKEELLNDKSVNADIFYTLNQENLIVKIILLLDTIIIIKKLCDNGV